MAISPPRVTLSVRPLDPTPAWMVLRGCAIAMMLVCAAGVANDLLDLFVPLDGAEAGIVVNVRYEAYVGIAVAAWIIFFLLGLALLWLTYRLTRNLHALLRNTFTLSPTYAIAYYFIPIANLVMPPQMVGTIARSTQFAAGDSDERTGPIGWWWGSYLIASLLSATSVVASQSNNMDPELYSGTYESVLWISIAAWVVGFTACWFMLRVFAPIVHAQAKLIRGAWDQVSQ